MITEIINEDTGAYKNRYIIMVIVLMGIMMSVIDGTVVSIALPTITAYFNVDVSSSQWTITAYLLTMTSLLLIFGRLSEYFGKVNLFMVGFTIFTLSSLACGLSSSLIMLIVCRVIQGFGAAMVFSISGAILFQAFPENERGKAMGFLGSAVAIGSIAGPVLGGLIVDTLGWEYIFLINVPIGIILLALSLKYLNVNELKSDKLDIDWPGSAILIVSMVSLMLFLGDLGKNVSMSPVATALAVLAIVSFVAFIYRESHCAGPLLDLSIFRIKKFTLPVLAMILTFIANFMLSIVGPFYFQGVLHYSASQVGILYLVTPMVMVIAAPVTGMLYDRTRSKYYACIGMVISALGYVAMGLLVRNFNVMIAVGIFILSGIGGSLFQSPNNTETMGSLPPRKLGIASSVTSTIRNLGMALGVSISAILVTFQLTMAGYSGPILEAGSTLIPIVSNVMFVSAALCMIAAAASLLRNV
ncbi:MFS transporter [Methanocella paludicola SANAE]|uniref:MFS transporter n=2 Tax=Methanocella TaxID=570266 RepID=D1YYM9_METPS|nr:MFS transporter [Methanocella paludicola SANAE]